MLGIPAKVIITLSCRPLFQYCRNTKNRVTTLGISDILENPVRTRFAGKIMSQIHNEVQTQFGNNPEYYARESGSCRGRYSGGDCRIRSAHRNRTSVGHRDGNGVCRLCRRRKVAHVTATDLTYEMLVKARDLSIRAWLVQCRVSGSRCGITAVCHRILRHRDLPNRTAPFSKCARLSIGELSRAPTSGLFCMIDTVCPESERLIQCKIGWKNYGYSPTLGRTHHRGGGR